MSGELGYDDIRKILQMERRTPLLTKIRPDYYQALADLIRDLMANYNEENRKDPTSSKTMMLHEELRKVRDLSREVYDHRLDKITRLATTSASGESIDDKNLAEGEKDVLERLTSVLAKSHEDLMQIESGTYKVVRERPPEPKEAQKEAEPVHTSNGSGDTGMDDVIDEVRKVDVPAPRPQKAREVASGFTVIQILEDLPPFKSLDKKEYNLRKKDVISLPTSIAENLVRARKARHINVQ